MNILEKRKMKPWLCPLLLFVSMFFAGGCNSDEDGGYDPSDYMEVELPPLSDELKNYFYTDPWRHWEAFENEKGRVGKFERSDGTVFWGVKLLSRPERFPEGYPLNMPEEYKVEGVEFVFSGETRDHPLINLNALPLILTDLKVKKSGGVIK